MSFRPPALSLCIDDTSVSQQRKLSASADEISLGDSFAVSLSGTLRTSGFEIRADGVKRSPNYSPLTPLQPFTPLSLSATPSTPSYSDDDDSDSNADASAYTSLSALVDVGALGNGACSHVRLAFDTANCRLVALKPVSIHARNKRRQLIHELSLLGASTSPYVVGFFGAFFHDDVTTVVLEYMNRNSLSHQMKRHGAFSERMLLHTAYHLFAGLRELHSRKIIHRDIKPANLLLNHDGQIKIADFGVAAELTQTNALANTFIGTTVYMAPERIKHETYSFATDIWSSGISLLTLAAGRTPFDGADGVFALVNAICNDTTTAAALAQTGMSAELQEIIASCLRPTPEDRPTADDLCTHPLLVRAEEEWSALSATERAQFHAAFADSDDDNDVTVCKDICEHVIAHATHDKPRSLILSLFDRCSIDMIAQQTGVITTSVTDIFHAAIKRHNDKRTSAAS